MFSVRSGGSARLVSRITKLAEVGREIVEILHGFTGRVTEVDNGTVGLSLEPGVFAKRIGCLVVENVHLVIAIALQRRLLAHPLAQVLIAARGEFCFHFTETERVAAEFGGVLKLDPFQSI